MNPFPGAYSYWTSIGGGKSEMVNPPEGDEWYQLDGDGDGFNNAQEVEFGSDPYSLDSDFDGLPDSVEFQYCMGATSALPYDPWKWDTNGNGFSDFDEFYQQIQSYNPVVNYASLAPGSFYSYSDADGDGLKNFEDSVPLNCDRDGDNILNWNEVAGQMDDPYNGAGPPNSDPPPPTDPGVIIGGTWYPTGTLDSDGDGTPDQLDSFPYGSFWYQGIEYGGVKNDRDDDGIPDPADPFPDGSYWYDTIEYALPWIDQDGDGVPDALDPWPTIAGSYWYNQTQYPGPWSDQDLDGIPDALDPYPFGGEPLPQDPWNGMPHYSYGGVEYPGSWSDVDNDGIPDARDPSPNGSYWYNGTEYLGTWSDRDVDGIPDDLDALPDDKWNGAPHFTYQGVEYPGSETDDRDGDGVPDPADAYPDDRTNRADSDSDGLSDYDETTQYGTDPAKADTDDDRLSDSDELFRYHTNPLLAKTSPDQPYSDFYTVNQADDDSDGIPNGIEQWYADQGFGMNPADPADARGDLDGDGYTNLQAWQNGWSLTAHTGPYDYDQDGILDVLEDAWNAAYPGMFDNHNFNDSVDDFDGDGLMNFEEIALGLNPGKANSRHASVSDVQEWAWRGLVVGIPAGLSSAGLGLNGTVQPTWQVMEDANHDALPDGLQAFVTALNADATLVTLPQRVASGDYDGDGMLDYWEHTYNLDLRSAADAQANPDGDTLINSLEYAHGRNPLVSDDPPPEDDPPVLPPEGPSATPQIITTSLPDGSVNAGYNAGIVVSGGASPYQFSLSSGLLPDGLYLDTNGGISGTPTTEMSGSFTVQVVDGAGLTAEQALTLNILPDPATGGGMGDTGGTGENGDNNPPPPLVITTTDAQMRAIIYRTFSVTLAASGGGSDSINYNYSGESGTLPAGLEFSADTNTIHGTPTVTGSYSFTLTVVNSGVADGSAGVSKDFTLTVHDPLAFVSEEQLPGAVRDSSYLSGFEMSGGYGPCHFSLASGELPPGLMLAANGQITGTPSVCGTYTFSVHVTDTFGSSLDKTFTLGVGEPPQPLTITTYSLPSGGVGIGYNAGIGASGGSGDYTFTGGGGIFSVSSTGGISGVPTEPGVYAVSVTVTDSDQNTASATYVISIEAPALAVTSGDKQILKVGDTPEPVTVSVTVGGVGLAGVPVSMGSQSTTTDEGGSATFLPSALMTEGAHDFAVNAPGCGATVQMFAYTLPAGAGETAPDILPGPAPEIPVRPVDDDDVIFESRSVSFTTGTLQAHYSGGMAVVYINGQFQTVFDGYHPPDYSSSKTIWSTSDGQSGEGTPPSLESLPWRPGLADGYDQKFPDTNEGPVDGPDLPGGEGGGTIWPDFGIAPFKIVYNGGYYGKSVGRQKHTTSQIRMRRKTVEEGGSGGTEAISKPLVHAFYTTGADSVETLSGSSTVDMILAENQNTPPPSDLAPEAPAGTTKREAEAPLLININDSTDTKDDIVRKEQKIGDKAWRQWIPCTVIFPNESGSQTTSIAVSSEGNTMKFAQDTQQKPNDETAGEVSVTVAINQGQAKFWITGITQSANIGDAKLQIKKNSANGELIATKQMTVFWFEKFVEISGGSFSTSSIFIDEDGDKRFGLKPGRGIAFTAGAQVVPNGLDPSVPQIYEWQFGVVQNCLSQIAIGYGDPQIAPGQAIAADDVITVPDKILKMQVSSLMLDAQILDEMTSHLYCGLEPGPMITNNKKVPPATGRSSFWTEESPGQAIYHGSDAPDISMTRKLTQEFTIANNPQKKVTVIYSTQWVGMDDIFWDWCGLVQVKHVNGNPSVVIGKFIPLRQRRWWYAANSKDQDPQIPMVEAADMEPDTIPVISFPIIAPNTVPVMILPDPDATNITLPPQ